MGSTSTYITTTTMLLLIMMTIPSLSLSVPLANSSSSSEVLPMSMSATVSVCQTDSECGNGYCREVSKTLNAKPEKTCVCIKPYIDTEDHKCSYPAKSKLVAFLLSFFLGGLGVDWFYLSAGNGGYIVGGIFKLITGGGLGLWWLVDWIRILAGSFNDGDGMKLFSDM